MPIQSTPIQVEIVERQLITADKRQILTFCVNVRGLNKEPPSASAIILPYSQATEQDNPVYASEDQAITWATADLYSAAANMAKAGYFKLAQWLPLSFDVTAEAEAYQTFCKSKLDAATATLVQLQQNLADQSQKLVTAQQDVETARSANQTAQANLDAALNTLQQAQQTLDQTPDDPAAQETVNNATNDRDASQAALTSAATTLSQAEASFTTIQTNVLEARDAVSAGITKVNQCAAAWQDAAHPLPD